MPELPDVEAYVAALRRVVVGRGWSACRSGTRSCCAAWTRPCARRKAASSWARGGWASASRSSWTTASLVVIHLMIAGRLRWQKPGAKGGLAAFDFPQGTLVFTEAGSKHRASLHLARSLDEFRTGAVEPLEADLAAFGAALRRENRTVKRALTDPRSVSGIGNAYSDEILHRAKMSPFIQTQRMTDDEVQRLLDATRAVLSEATQRLVAEAQRKWPDKVTAFRPEFAVHGKFGKPCPICGTTVQRIVKGENESNYCPRCQTGGRMLADRALSKLLHDDWPSTIDEWEERNMPGNR